MAQQGVTEKQRIEYELKNDERYFTIHIAQAKEPKKDPEEENPFTIEPVMEKLLEQDNIVSVSLSDVRDYGKQQKLPDLDALDKLEKEMGGMKPPADGSKLEETEEYIEKLATKRKLIASLFKARYAALLEEAEARQAEAKQAKQEAALAKLQEDIEKWEKERSDWEKKNRRKRKKNADTESENNEPEMPEHLQVKPTLPDDKPDVEPHPEPLVYIVLPDYPCNVQEIASFQTENLNYNSVLEVNCKTIAGPPKKPEVAEEEPAADAKKGKKADKKAAKKAPPKKGKGAPVEDSDAPTLVEIIRDAKQQASSGNIADTIRNVLVMQQTYYRYTYTEEYAEMNDGADDEYETKRFVENLESHLKSVAVAHRDYYDARGLKSLVAVTKHQEPTVANQTYYNELLHGVPDEACSIPVVLHCMIEQVVRNLEEEANPTPAPTEDEKDDNFSAEVADQLSNLLSENIELFQAEPVAETPPPPRSNVVEFGDEIAESNLQTVTINGVSVEEIEYEKLKLLNVFTKQPTVDSPLSVEERGARITELFHFTQKNGGVDAASVDQVQHQLNIFEFEKLLKTDLANRTVRESYTMNRFLQTIRNHCLLHLPELSTSFYNLESSVLLAYAHAVPAERFVRKQWRQVFSCVPYFGEWYAALQAVWEATISNSHEAGVAAHHATIEQAKADAAEAERLAKEREELARLKKKKRGKRGKEAEEEEEVVEQQEVVEEPVVEEVAPQPTEEELELQMISSVRPGEQSGDIETLVGGGYQRYVFEGPGADLHRDTKTFYPSDGSIVTLIQDSSAASNNTCSVYKDGVNFGVRSGAHVNFSSVFEDNTVVNVHAKEGTTTVAVGAINGLYYHQNVANGEILMVYPSHLTPKSSTFGAGFEYLKKNIPEEMTIELNPKSVSLSVFQDGAVVEVMTNEVNRVFIPGVDAHGGAAVMKNFANGCVQIIYANGETSTSCPAQQSWLRVSALGERSVRTGDDTQSLEKLHVATNVESQLDATIMSREDFVTKVTYKDGTILVQHTDGTRFWQYNRDIVNNPSVDTRVSKELNSVLVQHPLFGEITVAKDKCTISTRIPGIIKTCYNLVKKNIEVLKDGHVLTVDTKAHEVTVNPSSHAFLEKHNNVQLSNNQGVFLFNYQIGAAKTIDTEGHEFLVNVQSGESYVGYRTPVLGQNKRSFNDFSIPEVTTVEKSADEPVVESVPAETAPAEVVAEEPNTTSDEPKEAEEASTEEVSEEVSEEAPGVAVQEEEETPHNVLVYGRVPVGDKHTLIHEPRLFSFNIADNTVTEFFSEPSVYPFIESAKSDPNTNLQEEARDGKTGLSFVIKHAKPSPSVSKAIPKSIASVCASSNEPEVELYTKRSIVRFDALSEETRAAIRAGVDQWQEWDNNRKEHDEQLAEAADPEQVSEQVAAEEADETQNEAQDEVQDETSAEEQGEDQETQPELKEEDVDELVNAHVADIINNRSGEQDVNTSAGDMMNESSDEEEGEQFDDEQALDDDIASSKSTSSSRLERPQSAVYKTLQKAAATEPQVSNHLNESVTLGKKKKKFSYWDHNDGRAALQTIMANKTDEEKELDAMMASTNSKLASAMAVEESAPPAAETAEEEQQLEQEAPLEHSQISAVAAAATSDVNESGDTIVQPPSEPALDEDAASSVIDESMNIEERMSRGSSRPPLSGRRRFPGGKKTTLKKRSLRNTAKREPIPNARHRAQLNRLRKNLQSSEERNMIEAKLALQQSNFVVYPDHIDFGRLAIGQKYKTTALLTNSGNTTDRFTAKAVKDPNGPSVNPLSVKVARGPLPPGISRQITLMFTPSEAGDFNQVVRIKTPNHLISLTVSGTVSDADDELPAKRVQKIQFKRSLLSTIKSTMMESESTQVAPVGDETIPIDE